MELTLTVQPPASPAIDVGLNVDANRSVKELVEALIRATGVPNSLSEDMSAYLPNRDTWLHDDMPISQANLRVGEIVVLGRNSASGSVIMGDVVEKTRSAKDKKTFLGAAPFELAIVSGNENGTRIGLPTKAVVIIDNQGKVRVSDAKDLAKKTSSEPSIAMETSFSDLEFEGITQQDSSAFLVECDRNINITPIHGDTFIEVRKLKKQTEVDQHAMIVSGSIQFFVRRKVAEEPMHVSNRGIVGVNRPPRDVQPPTEHIINIDAPPREPQKTRISPIMIVIPALLGLTMFIIMSNPMFLMMMLFSPVMMIAQSFESKRTGKKEFKEGKAKYVADIDRAVHELRLGRRKELALRRVVFPDATDCISRIADSRHDIWDRRRQDVDFLALRVGVGDQTALVSATIANGGSEDLRDYGEKKLRRTDPIHLAPLAIPLPEYGAMGIVGERYLTKDLISWLILQTVALHSHRDLSLCAALPNEQAGYFEYFKWIPHITHGGAELDEPNIAFGQENSSVLFQKVRALIESRMSQSNAGFQSDYRQWPSIVLVIDEDTVRERTAIDPILKFGPQCGVFVIFISSQFRELPGECKVVVELSEVNDARPQVSISYPGSGQAPIVSEIEDVSLEVMDEISQLLAPMRDVTASVSGGGGGALPKTVGLLDVLDLSDPKPEELMRRWASPPDSLQAILGATTDGLMKIDMRTDGPHALVAGTTGAGKSELLQSFVLSMAVNYSPNKVNFLFVDYKGGTAFADCATIPHSVGMVTDLDEYLAQRVLISLNAELKRREGLLREYGAKDLLTFEKKFPNECPPSLLIVIDEFAALVREVPDFVEGIVDIAQRGRSLGLHLILATQRPAGVVNDNIRANTNLRIALRIADNSDSTDVIGTDEAARIPRTIPGRAFIRMGPSDLQGFQSAYGGDFTVNVAKKKDDQAELERKKIEVNPFTLLKLVEISQVDDLEVLVLEDDDDNDPDQDSDIKYLCAVINETAKIMELDPPRQPWKESLSSVIPLSDIGDPSLMLETDPGRRVILGVMDLPHLQDQQTYVHDFESDGNMFIYGTSSSGKTTALRTLAGSVAVTSTPNDAVIYAIDCASGGLECLSELPHCASVITTRNAEGLALFLSKMNNEMEQRKELFRREGVASLGEYRTRLHNNGFDASKQLPRIIILLDSFAGYNAAFEKVEYGAWIDAIQRLTAEGRPLGIHIVITADRRGAIPFNMSGLVEQKLILRMADPDELSSLGVPHKIAKEIKLSPGRALLKGELEIQIPTVSSNPDGASQVDQIARIGNKLRSVYGDSNPYKAQSLPEVIRLEQLPLSPDPNHAILGVVNSENGLLPCLYDLDRGNFVISGPRATGKTSTLLTIIRSFMAKEQSPNIYVFTPRPNMLSAVQGLHNVAVGAVACEEQLNELIQIANDPANSDSRFLLLIDDCEDLSEGMFGMNLESLMTTLRGRVNVVAAGDPSAFQRAYSGWLAEVKKYRYGILFKPDPQMDGEILGVKLRILPGQAFGPGRGFFCLDRESTQIQVAT